MEECIGRIRKIQGVWTELFNATAHHNVINETVDKKGRLTARDVTPDEYATAWLGALEKVLTTASVYTILDERDEKVAQDIKDGKVPPEKKPCLQAPVLVSRARSDFPRQFHPGFVDIRTLSLCVESLNEGDLEIRARITNILSACDSAATGIKNLRDDIICVQLVLPDEEEGSNILFTWPTRDEATGKFIKPTPSVFAYVK